MTHPPKPTGLVRLLRAFGHSCAGLRTACAQAAFRQELALAAVLGPAAFWLGQSWLEVAFLLALLVWVLVVEILNSAIEAVVDRIGPEWHVLSKNAKDLGSAAVLLSLSLCTLVWGWALWARLSSA